MNRVEDNIHFREYKGDDYSFLDMFQIDFSVIDDVIHDSMDLSILDELLPDFSDIT